jgi:hypothetical protein
MKLIFLLPSVILAARCTFYKTDGRMEDPPVQRFENTGRRSCLIKNFSGLPTRIKRMPAFKNQAVTCDSTEFKNKNGTASLFLSGAYDRKTKAGYVVQQFLLRDNGLTNQCTLFWVSDNKLQFAFTEVASHQTNWDDIKARYEAKEKEFKGIFGGGITVLKPIKVKKKGANKGR